MLSPQHYFSWRPTSSRNDQGKLAAVEATQSTELIFAMIGEMIILGIALPGPISLVGIAVIIVGMGLHSFQTALGQKKKSAQSHLLEDVRALVYRTRLYVHMKLFD